MSLNSNKAKAVFTVATKHDYITTLLHDAAFEVAVELENLGHSVRKILGTNANAETVYATLLEMQQSKSRIYLASFSGHGENDGIYDAALKVLVDKNSAKLLGDAIVLFQSCLKGGELPLSMINATPRVNACIGFSPELWAPKMGVWASFINPVVKTNVSKEFKRCLNLPTRSIMRGQSASTATRTARKAWKESAYVFIPADMRIAMCFGLNERNLSLWS